MRDAPPLPPEPTPRLAAVGGAHVCPQCRCRKCPVQWTRSEGNRTLRKRKCKSCGHLFIREERPLGG